MKSENALQQRMRQVSKTLLLVLLAFIAAISLWTPLAQPAIAARWFTLPNLFYLLPVPALVVIFSLYQWRCLNNPDSHSRPFILTLGLISSALAGLGSASGRTSFHRQSPCGRPPHRRKAGALCWSARY